MTPSSDLDLLVINDEGATRHERLLCPESGDQLDVVVMTRAMAERHRMSASYVQGAALEEGRTVYLREGATPTVTGPTYTSSGGEMVRTHSSSRTMQPSCSRQQRRSGMTPTGRDARSRSASTCSTRWSTRSRRLLRRTAGASSTRTTWRTGRGAIARRRFRADRRAARRAEPVRRAVSDQDEVRRRAGRGHLADAVGVAGLPRTTARRDAAGLPHDAPLDFAPAALQPLIRRDSVTDRRRYAPEPAGAGFFSAIFWLIGRWIGVWTRLTRVWTRQRSAVQLEAA